MRIYTLEKDSPRRRLVRIECDKDDCDAFLLPGPNVRTSNWTFCGYREDGEKHWRDSCPKHVPFILPSRVHALWGRTFERRYHAEWFRIHGASPLQQLGEWLLKHPGQIRQAPRELLTSALANVVGRLPKVAAREPTRRHRNHFAWLLGWHARLTEALA